MKDKFPEIYKNKIENLKSQVQKNFYYHAEEKNIEQDSKYNRNKNSNIKIDKSEIIKKINNIFKRPDYVYQAAVNIMYKNGENIEKKIIGMKDNYILTHDGEKINLDDISDIK